jgi:hypothetical protein
MSFSPGGCPSEVELMDTLKEIDALMEKYPHSHDSPLYQVPALLRKVSKLEYKRLRTRLAIVEGEVLRLWKKLGEPIPTVGTVVPPPTRSEAQESLLAHLKKAQRSRSLNKPFSPLSSDVIASGLRSLLFSVDSVLTILVDMENP